MSVVIVTPPAVEPLARTTLAGHLRVTDPAENDYLDGLIATARAHVETFTGRALISRTLDLVLDEFSDRIDLPRGSVLSVASVSYVDAAGVTQAVPPADYLADLASVPARVFPAYRKTWPIPRSQPCAVRVRYVAGYGAAPADVPPDLRHALLLLCGHLYENREIVITSNMIVMPLPQSFADLLAPYRLHGCPA